MTVRQFPQKYPEYRVVNVRRGDETLGAADDSRPAEGRRDRTRRPPRGADRQHGPDRPGGGRLPRSSTSRWTQAEILVTNKDVDGQGAQGIPHEPTSPGRSQLDRIERGGVPIPIGLETTLQAL